MKDRENTFSHELEVFGTEAELVIQFFYTYLSIYASLAYNEKALRLVNKTPLFWQTIVRALRQSSFITLGRIFDQGSKHNVDRLLNVARDNAVIFSKEALKDRKIKGCENANEWIGAFMKDVYVPTVSDFRRFKKYVSMYRKVYNNAYRDIRRKRIAHLELSNPDEVQKLFAKINTSEMQDLSTFPKRLHTCLWELFYNGREPVLRPMEHSINAMRMAKTPDWQSKPVQEHMVRETENFFRIISAVPNQEMHRT